LQYRLQYSGSDTMPELWCASAFYLQIGIKREPTSGLEPLTSSLYEKESAGFGVMAVVSKPLR
jgi:hypothetical protein